MLFYLPDVSYINFHAITNYYDPTHKRDVSYINFYAITNLLVTIMVSGTDVSYIYIFMQSPTRNPYDIVTEGIFSTIPLIFSLAKLLQIVESSKLSQISS